MYNYENSVSFASHMLTPDWSFSTSHSAIQHAELSYSVSFLMLHVFMSYFGSDENINIPHNNFQLTAV